MKNNWKQNFCLDFLSDWNKEKWRHFTGEREKEAEKNIFLCQFIPFLVFFFRKKCRFNLFDLICFFRFGSNESDVNHSILIWFLLLAEKILFPNSFAKKSNWNSPYQRTFELQVNVELCCSLFFVQCWWKGKADFTHTIKYEWNLSANCICDAKWVRSMTQSLNRIEWWWRSSFLQIEIDSICVFHTPKEQSGIFKIEENKLENFVGIL